MLRKTKILDQMCTYSITVDEQAIAKMHPSVSRESFGLLLQRYVDELVAEMTAHPVPLSPNAHSAEEMKSVVAQRIREMEAGNASYIDGEEGFATIRARYGL